MGKRQVQTQAHISKKTLPSQPLGVSQGQKKPESESLPRHYYFFSKRNTSTIKKKKMRTEGLNINAS